MSKPPLTVRNAAITTASVEIKTLTVSGKQVTLAVFRQLREVPVVTDEGMLAGQPWGVVNYHPDKCANMSEHWHVVWQDGEDLRRSFVTVVPVYQTFWSEDGDRFVTSCVHDLITTGRTPYFQGKPPVERLLNQYDGINVDTGHGFRTDLVLAEAANASAKVWLDLQYKRKSMLERADNGDVPSWMVSGVQAAERQLSEALPAFTAKVAEFEATTDLLYERYAAATEAERARRERHRRVREELEALPQLFIAV
ncbi:hypothetical protein [Actinosynnema sp. NPDC023587]|uniref:hypothetical protein n=1 Tax=Actinosynnema sp. NPDC023587 TaxID=3154695 RepID=UPI0033D6400B